MKNVMNAIGVGLAAFLVLVGAASMAEARYVGHPVARHNVGRGYVGHPVARSVNRNYGNYSGYRRYAYSTSYRRYSNYCPGEYHYWKGNACADSRGYVTSPYVNRGYVNRGYVNRGYVNRGYVNRRYAYRPVVRARRWI